MSHKKKEKYYGYHYSPNNFLWCTIINVIILLGSFLFCAFAGDWVYRVHSRWFPLSREAFNTVIYSFIALYKVLWIVFNLVPYLALAIIG